MLHDLTGKLYPKRKDGGGFGKTKYILYKCIKIA